MDDVISPTLTTNFLFSRYDFNHSSGPPITPHVSRRRSKIEWSTVSKAAMGVNRWGTGGTRPPHDFWNGEMSPPCFARKEEGPMGDSDFVYLAKEISVKFPLKINNATKISWTKLFSAFSVLDDRAKSIFIETGLTMASLAIRSEREFGRACSLLSAYAQLCILSGVDPCIFRIGVSKVEKSQKFSARSARQIAT